MNRETSPTGDRLLFFDMVRNLAMLSVVLYHAVAAYSTLTPHWSVHDGTSIVADGIRELFDVFMMPVFFFVAGYFAVPSLAKQGSWRFLKGKMRRLGVPWLVAILIIVPVTRYGIQMKSGPGMAHEAFWRYWIEYLRGVGTLHVGIWTADRVNQMHFWFLSLLLTFLVVFSFIYAIWNRAWRPSFTLPAGAGASPKPILRTLLLAAVMASLGYFVVSLYVSELSWVMVDLLWQFQPGGLILDIVLFLLGCLAYSRRWFDDKGILGRLAVWVPAVLLLSMGFFLVGQTIFAHPETSDSLSAALLLGFSIVRTFLCLSILILLIAYARRNWDRPARLNQKLSANSYNIYLVHIFFVTFLQDVLMIWRGGPPMAKAVVIVLVVLPISYGISRLIDRFPRWFVLAFVLLFLSVAVFTG